MMLFPLLGRIFSHRSVVIVGVLALLAFPVAAISAGDGQTDEQQPTLTIYMFWQVGCPYCAMAKEELQQTFGVSGRANVRLLEIGRDRQVDELFEKTLAFFGFQQGGVPLVVIADRALMGFSSNGRSRAAYMELVERCEDKPCRDIISELAGEHSVKTEAEGAPGGPPDRSTPVPQTITLPIIGDLDAGSLPLSVITVLLAAVDGFNPCAMWVLVFLIGLLMGLENRFRRWALGSIFLAVTAMLYFAVIAAWFNVVTFVGATSWLRYGAGALALWFGFYFLREYWTKPEAVCHVTNPGQRQRITSTLRATVANHSFLLAALGIAAMAILVNLIELVCSAGVPAAFTQILALNTQTALEAYAFIALYVFVFILDDIAIFAVGMITLEVTGLTGRYARLSHLVGGCVLLALGALLILRPDLLAFS